MLRQSDHSPAIIIVATSQFIPHPVYSFLPFRALSRSYKTLKAAEMIFS
jgi:hypothetical protein